MVEKSSFVKMLLHVLHAEAHPDIQSERWEEELTASGARDASGVVDVRHFVTFSQQGGVEGPKTVQGAFTETERRAAPLEPSNEKLAAIKPGGPFNPDRSLSISSLSTAVIGGQTPLPSPADQAGALVVVNSTQYVLGERLGHGAG
eukprot:4311054-Amphidinium_carterae.1